MLIWGKVNADAGVESGLTCGKGKTLRSPNLEIWLNQDFTPTVPTRPLVRTAMMIVTLSSLLTVWRVRENDVFEEMLGDRL